MSRERRNIKPEQAEAILQQKRDAEGMTGDVEVKVITNLVENAKRNSKIGDKVLLVIPPHYLHIPSWQRDCDTNRAKQIGLEYNKYKWEVPKAIYVNGTLLCADGLHRIFGASEADIDNVVVEVMEMPIVDAIMLFLNQTKDKGHMSQADYYKASLEAGVEKYVVFRNICHKYNVQIKGDDALCNPVGVFTSISDGIGLANSNPELLDRILNLINELQWNGNEHDGTYNGTAYSAKIIRSLKKLYAYNHKNMDVVDKTLMAQCKGSTWYKENFTAKPQEYMFDTLSKMVDKNKDKVSFIASTKAKRASKTS